MLVPIDEGKYILKKYEELWNKTRDLIRSISNNLGSCDQRYMKIKLNSDNVYHLKKTSELCNMIIAVF